VQGHEQAGISSEKSSEILQTTGSAALKIAKVAAIITVAVLQPEVGIPLMVADLTGVPVTPSPQAFATTTATVAEQTAAVATEGASEAKGAGKLFQPADLPDEALVVRGGQCKTENFTNGTGVTVDANGKLQGVSVNSQQGASLESLSMSIPNKSIGTTTVGAVRTAGGNVVPAPTPNNPAHATLSGVKLGDAVNLFEVFKK